MLASDLAELYNVETKQLIRQVKRNIERFEGDDFMFELSNEECNLLNITSRCQNGTLKRGTNIKYAPYAFTELGVAMLSSVLRSNTAIKVNREIMRAFVAMRQFIQISGKSGSNRILSHKKTVGKKIFLPTVSYLRGQILPGQCRCAEDGGI